MCSEPWLLLQQLEYHQSWGEQPMLALDQRPEDLILRLPGLREV